MPGSKIVFLSDIHIGNNAPTNWYQRDLHEPYLCAILDYVTTGATDIAELVILGDLVDQWTYVPSVRPPTVDEIIAANRRILGSGGALARAIDALDGRASYAHGNHDMGLGADEIARLTGGAPGGMVRLADAPIYAPAAGRGQVACTHGNIYSMFNAPDPVNGGAAQLPIGHYVTRLSALYAAEHFGPGQTAADFPWSGDPLGIGMLKDALNGAYNAFMSTDTTLARVLMDTLLDATGQGSDLTFTGLDGSVLTAEEVTRKYERLYEDWDDGARFPRDVFGRDPGLMALMCSDARNDLSHFADVLSVRYPVVVMGHTHFPENENPRILGAALYGNPGFNCPSTPDMTHGTSPRHVSFAEVEIDDVARQLTLSIRYVMSAGGRAEVADAPLVPRRSIAMRG